MYKNLYATMNSIDLGDLDERAKGNIKLTSY